jgi:DNA-binding transcriptional regulator YhcF (GntR family)
MSMQGQPEQTLAAAVAARIRAEIARDPERFRPGAELDSYERIAARLFVSTSTVHEAMDILARGGVVERPGPGLRVHIPGVTPREAARAEIIRTLREEWSQLPPGAEVPGVDRLAARFGVDRRVVTAIETELIRERVITPPRGRYAPRTPGTPAPPPRPAETTESRPGPGGGARPPRGPADPEGVAAVQGFVRQWIAANPDRDALPPSNQLANLTRTTLKTVNHALDALRRDGVITQPGSPFPARIVGREPPADARREPRPLGETAEQPAEVRTVVEWLAGWIVAHPDEDHLPKYSTITAGLSSQGVDLDQRTVSAGVAALEQSGAIVRRGTPRPALIVDRERAAQLAPKPPTEPGRPESAEHAEPGAPGQRTDPTEPGDPEDPKDPGDGPGGGPPRDTDPPPAPASAAPAPENPPAHRVDVLRDATLPQGGALPRPGNPAQPDVTARPPDPLDTPRPTADRAIDGDPLGEAAPEPDSARGPGEL